MLNTFRIHLFKYFILPNKIRKKSVFLNIFYIFKIETKDFLLFFFAKTNDSLKFLKLSLH
jgi:hypothetical protein